MILAVTPARRPSPTTTNTSGRTHLRDIGPCTAAAARTAGRVTCPDNRPNRPVTFNSAC